MLHLRSKREDTSHKDEFRANLVRLFVRLLTAFSDLLSNTNDCCSQRIQKRVVKNYVVTLILFVLDIGGKSEGYSSRARSKI